MYILALETATEACSAALMHDGQVHERFEVAPREHTRLILPMVEALLAEAGIGRAAIDGLAFGRGPGSFTGVRVATGVVQGLAFALDRPVVPVSTLAALAQGRASTVGAADGLLAAIDARMGEVYWGQFGLDEAGLVVVRGEEQVVAPEAVSLPAAGVWLGVGSGFAAHGEALASRLAGRLAATQPEALPRAGDVARLAAAQLAAGGGVAAEQALPVYLRDRVAQVKR